MMADAGLTWVHNEIRQRWICPDCDTFMISERDLCRLVVRCVVEGLWYRDAPALFQADAPCQRCDRTPYLSTYLGGVRRRVWVAKDTKEEDD